MYKNAAVLALFFYNKRCIMFFRFYWRKKGGAAVTELYRTLLEGMKALVDPKEPVITGLANASALLYQQLPDLNWAGFYMVRGHELALGPFQGKPACTRIEIGRGVCGSAWKEDQVLRVMDVHAFPGHIACDSASASEIVLPIHQGGKVAAVLDLDSPQPGRFLPEDEEGLRSIAKLLEERLFSFQPYAYVQNSEAPIGIMDSGVGGISVLKEIMKQLPKERCVYYGDFEHAPYGTRQVGEVQQFTFASVEKLLRHGVKALVIACNTATSASIARLREYYEWLPVVGIEPALKPAAMQHAGDRILVMATPMTLREDKFQHLVDLYGSQAEILPVSCEGLMEFVEKGILDGPELEQFLRERLGPYLPADSVVLGCTHYPFVRETVRKIVGETTAIWDGGAGTARELKRRLEEKNLLRREGEGGVLFLNQPEFCERMLHYGD